MKDRGVEVTFFLIEAGAEGGFGEVFVADSAEVSLKSGFIAFALEGTSFDDPRRGSYFL